jgi:glycine cleavage system H protein
MSKPLVFMMGQSPVFLPVDRSYVKNHMWARGAGEDFRFGLSAYAVRLLGAIRDLEWSVGPGTKVDLRQPIGSIEGAKAVSELYAPQSGTIVAFNLDLLLEPDLINRDPYETAWLFAMKCPAREFLSPGAYLVHVESSWPIAERMLHRQAGAACDVKRPGTQ